MYVCVSAREDAQEVCCALVYGLYLNGRQVGKVRSVLSIPVVFITMNILFSAPTVKLEVQLRHRLPPSLERSGKGGGRRWKPGIRVIRQYKIKKGDLCLPRINYFCIVYEV